jgi:superfamily II DNA or RNA helicase
MSYFSDNYDKLRFPLEAEDRPGFRLSQAGAIHALASHFSIRNEPAIITMPTGSGKTAVLIAAAFVLRASRVLILTPSRLVREQIAEELEGLTKLREIGAVLAEVPNPKVKSIRKRIATAEEWEALRGFDAIVATVQSISPDYENAVPPPADFFDLVLVDEAHHSPARTWKSILGVFPNAQRVLLTATPFRQDAREIHGRFVYTYDLRKAYEDGVFGNISFRPVTPGDDENHDIAIAIAAEQQLNADRTAGYRHVLMVRTDSRKRAGDLFPLYEQNTGLKLKIVTGDKSLRYVKEVIRELQEGTLDGIICVNMLGEGFNFPNLKVAAIHSPHRSLSVTLQFIGRFARTAGENLGPATFLAIPSDIEIEAEKLYDTRAVWQEVVQNLSATRVHEEAQIREVLESFTPAGQNPPDLNDLSLYSLEPYFHAKVYQLAEAIDINDEVEFPRNLQVVYRANSDEYNAAVYITREISLPRWTNDDRLAIVEPDLFIFHQDTKTNLLFVCASRRSKGLYEEVVKSFVDAAPRPLPLARLNRALNELTKTEFFNVGMRNRVASNTNESYRIITGSTADKSVHKSDGRLYHRGHFFGRAEDGGELVTIGLSSASKIWSNTAAQLPELIAWFEKLARRISSDQVPVTNSGLDFLSTGEEATKLPEGIICAEWAASAYRTSTLVHFLSDQGHRQEIQLIDLDITIDPDQPDEDTVALIFSYEGVITYRATFSFETNRFFEPASDHEPLLTVESDRDDIPFIEYLNDEMLIFYTKDLAMLEGFSLFRAPEDDLLPFDDGTFDVVDWENVGVDSQREFGPGADGKISVHQYIENQLASSDSSVAYYDHGSGEVADFVSIHPIENGEVVIRFYVCKGATGAQPGHRVGDCYEVVGQAVKSIPWARWQKLEANIRRRFTTQKGSHRFIKGDLAALETIFQETPASKMKYEYIAVQPGLLKEGLPAPLSNLLAAASDYLVRGGFMPLRVMGA